MSRKIELIDVEKWQADKILFRASIPVVDKVDAPDIKIGNVQAALSGGRSSNSVLAEILYQQMCGDSRCRPCATAFQRLEVRPYASLSGEATTNHASIANNKFAVLFNDRSAVLTANQQLGFCAVCSIDLTTLEKETISIDPTRNIAACSVCANEACYMCGAWWQADTRPIEPSHDYGSNTAICQSCIDYTRDVGKLILLTCAECRILSRDLINDYCRNCSSNRPVLNYTFKPPPRFLSAPNEKFGGGLQTRAPLFFGMEIEINPRNDNTGPVEELSRRLKPMAYLKSDVSTGPGGVEIVTHPGTFAWWNDPENKFLLEMEEYVGKHWVGRWAETCGIHIHMSRAPFTKLGLALFLRFMYDNKDFSVFCAERDSSEYASFSNEDKLAWKSRAITGTTNHVGRYCAINLENTASIEVRIFRSSTKAQTIRKDIQFLHSVFVFTHSYRGINNYSMEQYLDFIRDYPKDYPELLAFVENEKEGWYTLHPEYGTSIVAIAREQGNDNPEEVSFSKMVSIARKKGLVPSA